jgi:sec-independent protein translocase protein TatB
MEILGIGASELIFILIIAIIFLGPKDMQKAGRTIGRWLNYFIRSDGWRALQRASQEIRRLPTHLMREANLDAAELREIDQEIRRTIDPRPAPAARRKASVQRQAATSSEQPVDPAPEPTTTPDDATSAQEKDD